jgi:hypothetical protein
VRDESPSGRDSDLFDVDTSGTFPARVQSYLAGGNGHFAVDRSSVDYITAALPEGVDSARAHVQAMESFTARVVGHLVGTVGVRQFLNIGASIPGSNEVHEIAQAAAPATRVVYVGSDPVVLAHAHARRESTALGATAYVHGTLSRPGELLRQAADTLDLARPVALMLPVTLNFVPDQSDPYGIVQQLLHELAPGSYLVISHIANDIPGQGCAEAAKRLGERLREPFVVRSRDEVARFFDGLELVAPGVVEVTQWQIEDGRPCLGPGQLVPIHVGVGRKPHQGKAAR